MPPPIDAAARIAALRAQCGGPRDGALLRVMLGQALIAAGDAGAAAHAFEQALGFDAHYTAAWKLLGRARLDAGDPAGAAAAWQSGIAAAEAHGDVQAGKEMRVFLRRLQQQG